MEEASLKPCYKPNRFRVYFILFRKKEIQPYVQKDKYDGKI